MQRSFETVKYFRLGEHWNMISLHNSILKITQIQSFLLEQNWCCFWESGQTSTYQCYFSFLSNGYLCDECPVFPHMSSRLAGMFCRETSSHCKQNSRYPSLKITQYSVTVQDHTFSPFL